MNGVPYEADMDSINERLSAFYSFKNQQIKTLSFDTAYRKMTASIIYDLHNKERHPCRCDSIAIDDLEYLVKKTSCDDWEFRCAARCEPLYLLNTISNDGKIDLISLRNYYHKVYHSMCMRPNGWLCGSGRAQKTRCVGCYFKNIINRWSDDYMYFRE